MSALDAGGPMEQRAHDATETLRRSADRLQALARTGLFFADNEYDRVRYEEIVSIAAELCGLAAHRSPAELQQNWAGDVGYVTPRVGVGAVIFNVQPELLPHHARAIADAFAAPDDGPVDAAFDQYDPES
jgi:hypothetical protein